MEEKKTPLQINFGRQVTRLRKEIGLSQEKLGFESGLDRTYISGIERGQRNPSLNNIGKISKALKMTLPELFKF
jgi:transcriptional regulator with XRE-family HTH domain